MVYVLSTAPIILQSENLSDMADLPTKFSHISITEKRGKNDPRICNEKKVFSRERGFWFCREDVIEISKADRIRLIEKLEKESYTEIEYFNRRNER